MSIELAANYNVHIDHNFVLIMFMFHFSDNLFGSAMKMFKKIKKSSSHSHESKYYSSSPRYNQRSRFFKY